MNSNEIKRILKLFNFSYGIEITGKELSENEQKFLGLVHSRREKTCSRWQPTYIHSDEFRLLLGKNVSQPKIRESLAAKDLLHSSNYSMINGVTRNYLLSKDFNRALKSKKGHRFVRYSRKERVISPKEQMDDFHLAQRFEKISLNPKVTDLLESDWPESKMNRLSHDVWRILHKKHYCKKGGQTGREYTLINGIKSELRGYLTYDEEPLVEGDISACHPALLISYFDEYSLNPKEKSRYVELLSTGDFYAALYNILNKEQCSMAQRKRFKTSWNAWLNGAENKAIEEVMIKYFPALSSKLLELGAENARKLQRIESAIMADMCLEKAKEWERPYFSIHDGWMCFKSDFNGFGSIILSAFRRQINFDMVIKGVNFKFEQPSTNSSSRLTGLAQMRNERDLGEITTRYQSDVSKLALRSVEFVAHGAEQYIEIGDVKWHPETKNAKCLRHGKTYLKFESIDECLEKLKPRYPSEN